LVYKEEHSCYDNSLSFSSAISEELWKMNPAYYFAICLISLVVYLIRKNYNVWGKRGFLQMSGSLPFGSFKGVGCIITRFEALDSCYRRFRGKTPAVGYYSLMKANLLLLDPKLIKNVLVKDFTSFHERTLYHNKKDDPISVK
jgi:cytochrome P450 family 6